jgi:lipoate-protein ligase B
VNQPSSRDRETCWVVDLGLLPYAQASELQSRAVTARKRTSNGIPDVLLLCEHPHVITLGRNGKRENLKAGERILSQMNVELQSSDRGGDITYHGPGQIVGYPILDLARHRKDVRWYVEQLEEVMIRASAPFGVTTARNELNHGIWADTASGPEKLAAIGVHLSRWVTSHGFAYNVSTNLHYFDLIVPCGLAGKRATSLERLLDRAIDQREVRSSLVTKFGEVFSVEMVTVSRDEFAAALESQETAPAVHALTDSLSPALKGSEA